MAFKKIVEEKYYEFQAVNSYGIVVLTSGMFAKSYEEAQKAARRWWRRKGSLDCALKVVERYTVKIIEILKKEGL